RIPALLRPLRRKSAGAGGQGEDVIAAGSPFDINELILPQMLENGVSYRVGQLEAPSKRGERAASLLFEQPESQIDHHRRRQAQLFDSLRFRANLIASRRGVGRKAIGFHRRIQASSAARVS